jgi:adenylate cyclase
LSKYLPPQVYASIFKGQNIAHISAARKKLTIFFADLTKFSGVTESLEAEELTAFLNRFLTEMSKIALAHGATIDKYIGDAIMVFFGDPGSRGTKADALACVQMAMAMQQRMQELEPVWREHGIDDPVQMRVGINTGYCTVGNFGSEERMDYTAVGSAVNLAWRLQGRSEPGEILLAQETFSLVNDQIAAEPQNAVDAKGFPKPVGSYRVIGRLDELAREGRIIRERDTGVRIYVDL